MNVTKQAGVRGRPRRFDPAEAVATAQKLFHARGYDSVSVADVTEALGINPPSFYAAFGSKAGLYGRVLDRWSQTGAVPLNDVLQPDRPVAEALTDLLELSARFYASDPEAPGCLVLEGTRCNDREARKAACAFSQAAEAVIRHYVAARHPKDADRIADFVGATMSGLSAKARNGHGLAQLLATARLAGSAVMQALPPER